MKTQALRDSSMQSYMSSKKIMEINPENAIMEELRKRIKADKYEKQVKDLVMVLYEVVLVTLGSSVEEANTFIARVHRMIKLCLTINDESNKHHGLLQIGSMRHISNLNQIQVKAQCQHQDLRGQFLSYKLLLNFQTEKYLLFKILFETLNKTISDSD